MLEHSTASLIAHGVQILTILYCVDLLDQVLEDIANVDISKRTCFHEEQFVLAGVVCGEFTSDLTLTGVLLGQVKFVTDEHDDNFGLGVLPHLLYPLLHGHEGLLLRYVVDD